METIKQIIATFTTIEQIQEVVTMLKEQTDNILFSPEVKEIIKQYENTKTQ